MNRSACCPAACCVPLVADELSRADAEATAAMFKALADPARVRLVAGTKEEAG